MHNNGLYARTHNVSAVETVKALGLSPRVYVYGGKHRALLFNIDTWRLIMWAAQRNPNLLDRLEVYLKRWLGTKNTRAAERELRKLARLKKPR